MTNDGAVKAIIAVERAETFELLQRDARGLEKALQDAGLKTGSGSLSFNLRGETSHGDQAKHEDAGLQNQGREPEPEDDNAAELGLGLSPVNPLSGSGRALDMRV